MIRTSTMIKEDQKNDLNIQMQEALKPFPIDAPRGTQLTSDGVHLNAYGHIMMLPRECRRHRTCRPKR